MTKKFKKIAVSVMAVTALAMGTISMNVSAYYDSDSMILRSAIGAPGNVGSGTLKINTVAGGNYFTKYSFSNNTNAFVSVFATNASNMPSVVLDKGDNDAYFYNIQVNNKVYASFDGHLNGDNEWGTWRVCHANLASQYINS